MSLASVVFFAHGSSAGFVEAFACGTAAVVVPIGRVVTAKTDVTIGDRAGRAVHVVDGRIAWLGATGDAPAADRVIAGEGALLTPAFVDAHVHATATGLALSGLDLTVGEGRVLGLLGPAEHARVARMIETDPAFATFRDAARHPTVKSCTAMPALKRRRCVTAFSNSATPIASRTPAIWYCTSGRPANGVAR